MKPSKWAETIVWKSYPDCKPELSGLYIILVKDTRYSMDGADRSKYKVTADHWVSELYHNHNISYWAEHEKANIIAFAELPTGEVGEEFGFETAVLLMKEGIKCQSIVDGTVIFMEDGVFKTNEHNNIYEKQLWSDQILGKWRLA